MTTKLIAVPKSKQDVQQKDVRQQDVPKQDVHKLKQAARQQVDPAEYLAVFPEYPPRGDMNNPIYIHEPSHMRSLAIHFGRDETTFVMSEVPVSPSARIQREHRRPDLMVAFNCDRDLLIRQKGYATMTQGKPPDFVLEVASESTGRVDYTDKREEYTSYGIPEYWRFDSSHGIYHDAALAGDRLVDGKYEPIEIKAPDAMSRYGYSDALDLWLCWEDYRLRLFDDKTGQYLRTHDDEYDRAELEAYARRQADLRAIQAESRAKDAETRAEDAEARAQQAETRAAQEAHARQQEAQARQQAEAQAAAESRARQQAQAEIQRLQAQLNALNRPDDD